MTFENTSVGFSSFRCPQRPAQSPSTQLRQTLISPILPETGPSATAHRSWPSRMHQSGPDRVVLGRIGKELDIAKTLTLSDYSVATRNGQDR